MEDLVNVLIASRENVEDEAAASSNPVTGTFRLVYASTREPFRSSIFFWAFKQALSVSRAAETAVASVFQVTGALPGVATRDIVHEISEREIRSVVDLDIYPGLRGDVVSTGRLERPLVYDRGAEEQCVRVETTRVVNSNYVPVPAVWAAPVGRVLDAVGGGGRNGATAKFSVVYGDEIGHAIRVGGGVEENTDLFIYERVD